MAERVTKKDIFHLFRLSKEIDSYLAEREDGYIQGSFQSTSWSDTRDMNYSEFKDVVSDAFSHICDQVGLEYSDRMIDDKAVKQDEITDKKENYIKQDFSKPVYFGCSTPPDIISQDFEREEIYHEILNRYGPEAVADQFETVIAWIADELDDPELRAFVDDEKTALHKI